MTRQEMIVQLSKGKKIRHKYFSPDEWIQKKENGGIYSEDGACWGGGTTGEAMEIRKGGFWDDDWELVEEEMK